MKYIELLQPIALANIMGEPIKNAKGDPEELTHEQFLLGRLADQSFGADLASVLRAAKIQRAILDAKGTAAHRGYVALEDADFDALRKAVEKPAAAYNPLIAACLVPFMRAVVEAKDEAPALAPEVKEA